MPPWPPVPWAVRPRRAPISCSPARFTPTPAVAGLFAGVSLEGAALALDWQSNVDYYQTVVSPPEILAGADVSVPRSAAWLKGWLDYYTRPLGR